MGLRVSRFLPRPRPARHPLWRKVYLWLLTAIGTVVCVALIATGVAPSPGHHQQLILAVVGAAGIVCAAWTGLYAHRIPVGAVSDAMKRMGTRENARRLVATNPGLAGELGIGGPDLPRAFDDGGLVDVNHVPASCLAALPGLDEPLARKIAQARDGVGGFTSAADLEVTLGLPPGSLDEARDLLLFRPLR